MDKKRQFILGLECFPKDKHHISNSWETEVQSVIISENDRYPILISLSC